MADIHYLSETMIGSLEYGQLDVRGALARAFRLHADHRTHVNPKQMLPLKPGHFFQSLCAASSDLGYAAHKWVGVASENAAHGLPSVNGLVVLSDFETAMPVAVLDGNALTVLRTAAMSALAGTYLARPDSRSIGFIGCGRQALGHLTAFLDLMPGLRRVVCMSAGHASAERLAAASRERGLDATASKEPDAALACDIVVTSVQASPGMRPFLDASRLEAGSFVAAVDLGSPWRSETLAALDLVATDDRAQADEPSTRARLAFAGRFDADLAELVTQPAARRTSPSQRAMFLFPGYALADLAVAVAVLEAAKRLGVGLSVPR